MEPVTAIAVEPAPAPAEPVTVAPVDAHAATPDMPTVATYTLPVQDMLQVAQAAGLEWVNSDLEKVARVQAAIAAEPQPVRVPREPRPAVVVDDGPLVLVETRRDLREVTLPFENQ